MALSNMGRAWGSGLLGPLKENFAWDQIFLWIAILPLIILIFIQFINFIQHKKHIDGFILAHENLAIFNVNIEK